MKRVIVSIISALFVLSIMAQVTPQTFKELRQNNLHREPFNLLSSCTKTQSTLLSSQLSKVKRVKKVAEEADEEFILSPQGEEQIYVMSLYSYDGTNSKFVKAQSLKSQVRCAADGHTLYFKDITCSLGVDTWLKGEKRVMKKDSLEVGIQKGDTIIDIPFGQSLAYYKGQYLIFFVPMKYTDKTGETEVQDNYTLILRGDSLVQPTLPEGIFQGAAGYVFISEKTQGKLSFDIAHEMRLERKSFVEVPANVAPETYVYTFINSYGNIYKKKANVIRQGNDLYMQLSTSAPDAYVKGTLQGSQIHVESGQLLTDNSFIYYYSLADPVYQGDELVDFIPTNANRLEFDEETRSITSTYSGTRTTTVFSADYMDGMEMCRDYISNPQLKVYGGDKLATPSAPIWRSLKLDSEVSSIMTYNYMSFVLPALDVDSNYINVDSLTYQVYLNDTLYTFMPSIYKNLSAPMTEVPANFSEGYDFYTYDQLHYVYLYVEQKDVNAIGIQSVYTVNGQKSYSEIATQRFDNPVDPDDGTSDYELALTCRLKDAVIKLDEKAIVRGTIENKGKKDANALSISYTLNGQTQKEMLTEKLASGKSMTFEHTLEHQPAFIGETMDVEVSVHYGEEAQEATSADNNRSLKIAAYAQSTSSPTILLEEFTAESCGWCPYGAYRIHTAIEEGNLNDNVVWVCHHEGFGTDWLTAPESSEYTALYGGSTFAPAWMVDRNQKYSDEDYPVFSIGEIDEVKATLDNALQSPCFVEMSAENTYNQGNLVISIRGTKSNLFDVQCSSPRLTVFIVEDSIPSKKQKSYTDNRIPFHHNALRDVLTDTWGDSITWNGNTFEATYTFSVPEEYTLKNLSAIAFIHEQNNDVNERRIFNSTLSHADVPTGIESINANKNEKLNEDSALRNDHRNNIYNLHGQRVNTLYRGIIIRNGKIIVR